LVLVAKFAEKGMPSTKSSIQHAYKSEHKNISQDNKLDLLLNKFFEPQEKVLRLELLKRRINASRRKGEVTLLTYYISLNKEEKNANMLNMDQ
jgi:hypothetical protein